MSDGAGCDVVTVGEPMALFIAQQAGALEGVSDFHLAAAGSELNVAIGLARLGLRVAYISRVGDDSFGRHLLALMDKERIVRTGVAIDPRRSTGMMLKSFTGDGGDARIEYHRRGSAASHLSISDHSHALCAAARHLHLTGISPALSDSARQLVFLMARRARESGCPVSFDPNLRPQLWSSTAAMITCVNELAALSDLVLPGLAEGRLLTGLDAPREIAQFYLDRGAQQVVVKLGARGAYAATSDTSEPGTWVPAVPVARVIDTVGAGDGFAVGVISGLLEGLPLIEAVQRGHRIGARVVQFPGDSDGLPTRAELLATG